MSAPRSPSTPLTGSPPARDRSGHEVDVLSTFRGAAEPRDAVASARRMLKRRLSGYYIPDRIIGLEEQAKEITTLLEKTLEGQGTTEPFLLLGPHGSGKHVCLRYVLARLREKYRAQGKQRPFRVVYVDGLVHTTDAAALRHIAEQLSVDLGAGVATKRVRSGKQGADFVVVSTDSIKMIITAMQRAGNDGPLFLVLENMDTFACKTRQVLLYTFLDLQHRKDLRFTIIGTSRLVNLPQMFEKRVKSRLSNKSIFFYPQPLETLLQILDQVLHLPAEEGSENPRAHAKVFNQQWAELRSAGYLTKLLRAPAMTGRPMTWFFTMLLDAVSALDDDHPTLNKEDLARAMSHLSDQDHSHMTRSLFSGLGWLELLVVIALKRLCVRGQDAISLDMIWREYEELMKKEPLLPARFTRSVIKKGLQRVLALKLATPYRRDIVNGISNIHPVLYETSLEAGVEDQALRINFYPKDLEDFLHSQDSALPVVITRWGTTWTK